MTTSPVERLDAALAVKPEASSPPTVGTPKDMAGKLVRHGSIYVVARVATMGAPYLLLPLYARLLGDAGLGTVELLASISAFLTPILLQGLGGSWVRLRFDHETAESRAVFDSTIVWYLLFSSAVALLLLALLGPWIADFVMPGIPFHPLGMLAVAAAAAGLFSTLCERKLQTEQRPLAFALFSLLRACLSVGVIALFVLGFQRGVLGKLEADLLWGSLLAVIGLMIIRPGAPRLVSASVLKKSLVYGLPLVPHSLAALTGGLVGRLLLNGMLGVAAVGVFSMGFRLATAANVMATALNQAYAPIYVKTLKDADEGGDGARALRDALAQSALVSVILVSAAALAITAWGRELIAVIATPEFDESWRVLAILNAASVAYACYLPFSQGLLQSPAGTRSLPLLTLSAAVVSVVTTLLLVPTFGITGAAWATFAGNALLAVAAFVVGQRLVSLPIDKRRWTLTLVVVSTTLAALAAVDALSPPGPLTRLLPKTVLLSAALVALLTLGGGVARVRRLLRPPR